MKYYVISDVHGFYDEMITALSSVGFFNEKEPCKLVLLGDAFDRGTKPKEIIEFLTKLYSEDRLIYILGNHEDMLLGCIQSFSSGSYPKDEYFTNGTVDTLLNITNFSLDDAFKFKYDFMSNILKTDLYRDLLRTASDYYETNNYLFTHGFIPCHTKGIQPITDYKYMDGWRNAEPIEWKKARWLNPIDAVCKFSVKEKGKTIVCGHWHSYYGHSVFGGKKEIDYSPFYADGIIAIDGATFESKKVNCIIIED